MKKKSFFLSCALAVSAMFASAGDLLTPIMKYGSYSLDDATQARAKAAPASATMGDSNGVEIFGTTFMDATRRVNAVKVNPNDLYNFERLNELFPDDNNSLYRVLSGEYVDGTYYCHVMAMYTFVNYYAGWGKIDINTGKFTWINSMESKHGYNVPYNFGGGNYYCILDMAYNRIDGKLYGVAMNSEGGFDTVLGTVNLQDGEFTPIADFEGYVYSISFDLDGNLYVAHNVGTYVESWYEESEGTEIARVDYKNITSGTIDSFDRQMMVEMESGVKFRPMGFGTMTTDNSTGMMYFFINPENTTQSAVFSIDLRNKNCNYLGKFGWSDMLTGATILPTEEASDRKAPAKVNDLTVAYDANGGTDLTASWTNPVSTWDLTDLTDLTSMKVAVDSKDNVVATLPAALTTESYTYTITGLTTGAHRVYVTAVNSKGDGVASYVDAWAGHDVPGMPVKLEDNVSTLDGKTVIIKWDASAEGKNGGWYDKENVKYNIVRMPDNVTVATGVDGLTYTDTTIDGVRSYCYLITGVTADGEGATLRTDEITVGGALTVPYTADFTDSTVAKSWSVFDGVGYQMDAYAPHWQRLQIEVSRFPVDYYFAAPKIQLKGGHTYNVKFYVYFHNQRDEYHNCPHDYEIVVGTEATKEALNTVLLDVEDSYIEFNYTTKEVEVWYTPETDGEYVFAFHLDTDKSDEDFVGINGFSISENFGVDLQAVSLTGTQYPADHKRSEYVARIYNNGNTDVNGFDVEVVRRYGEYNLGVVGNARYDGILPAHEYVEVTVPVTPKDISGEMHFAAHVVVPGDGREENDYSTPLYVEVLDAGSNPVNHKILGEYVNYVSNAPIGFSDPYYGYQAIYLADEINYEALKDEKLNEPVSIYTIAYPFVLNEGCEGDLESATLSLDVYMSNETRKTYKRMDQAIIPANQKHVFSGNVTIKGGDNRYMTITLNEPFELEEGKNLVITLIQDGGTAKCQFPLSFQMYNTNENLCSPRNIMHHGSRPYPVETAPTALSGSTYCGIYGGVPVVWMSVPTSIDGIMFNPATGDIDLSALDNAIVKVFDLTGKSVFAGEFTGNVSTLPLANGLYILNVTVGDNTANFKVRINR